MIKQCKSCKKRKRTSSFYVAYIRKNKKVFAVNCKTCSKKYAHSWSKDNKDRRFFIMIKSLYNLTKDQYFELHKKQASKCAICKIPESKLKIKLCVDHCHKSGIVRGLLCGACNRGLGLFEDNCQRLERAKKYLCQR